MGTVSVIGPQLVVDVKLQGLGCSNQKADGRIAACTLRLFAADLRRPRGHERLSVPKRYEHLHLARMCGAELSISRVYFAKRADATDNSEGPVLVAPSLLYQ